jgi:uncharacterized protein
MGVFEKRFQHPSGRHSMKYLYLSRRWIFLLFPLLWVMACVTINIYFPAEKVESVAGEIVQDIRGLPPREEDKSSPNRKEGRLEWIRVALSPSQAWAQDFTGVSNPTIRALKEQMKRRYEQLKPFYQKGVLVEGDDGYVSMKESSGLDLKTMRDVKALVTAENKDRRSLYTEVAQALKIDLSQVDRVAAIFAAEWKKTAP